MKKAKRKHPWKFNGQFLPQRVPITDESLRLLKTNELKALIRYLKSELNTAKLNYDQTLEGRFDKLNDQLDEIQSSLDTGQGSHYRP